MKKNRLFIFSGINGAGKSTFTQQTKIDQKIEIVNPDVITFELIGRSQNLPKGINVTAGRIALERREQYINDQISFGFESTLSSKQDFKTIHKALEKGYAVELVYVGLNDVKLAKDRVKSRVEKGGHDIPGDVIERRYNKSLENLAEALKIVDSAKIYDNSETSYKFLFEIQNQKLVYKNSQVNDWAKFIEEMYQSNNMKKIFSQTLKKVRLEKQQNNNITHDKKLKL